MYYFRRMPSDKLNRLALELGVLKATGTGALDSFQIFRTAEAQDTYKMLRSSLRKLLVRVLGEGPRLGQ